MEVVAVQTGQVRRVTGCPAPAEFNMPRMYCTDVRPEWSRDGRQILFSAAASCITICGGTPYIVNVNGSRVRRLTGLGGGVGRPGPQWPPNGRTIAFNTSQGIYTVHPNGSHLTRVLSVPAPRTNWAVVFTSWSPDGTHLHYVQEPYNPTLANGSHLKSLYGEPSFGYPYVPDGPEWSPDGRYIAFGSIHRTRKHTFTGMIYVIDANGARRHVLVSSGEAPAWRPVR